MESNKLSLILPELVPIIYNNNIATDVIENDNNDLGLNNHFVSDSSVNLHNDKSKTESKTKIFISNFNQNIRYIFEQIYDLFYILLNAHTGNRTQDIRL